MAELWDQAVALARDQHPLWGDKTVAAFVALTIASRCHVAVHHSSLPHVSVSQSARPASAVGTVVISPKTRPSHQPIAPLRSVIPTTSTKPATVANV